MTVRILHVECEPISYVLYRNVVHREDQLCVNMYMWGDLVVKVLAHQAEGLGSNPHMSTMCDVHFWCSTP